MFESIDIGLPRVPGSAAAAEVAGFYTAVGRRQRLARIRIALTRISGAVARPGNVAMKLKENGSSRGAMRLEPP
jgi:hypothetical protein